MLSLYPVFVKNIHLPVALQMWSRFISYIGVSLFFIDYGYVWAALRSGPGLALMAVTIAHIYTSYEGFMLLDSGPAYTLFYIYPVIILFLSGNLSWLLAATTFAGAYILASADSVRGTAMIVGAAFTEALIYFLVKKLKTKNSWNHLFISYIGGAVLLTAYFARSFSGTSMFTASLGINGLIGMFGYVLRFYSISRLSVFWYAMLSNVGIVMSYVYGYLFNGELVHFKQIAGSALVVIACLISKLQE
jgi:drug/metabolite transporter (DMT)-like permease